MWIALPGAARELSLIEVQVLSKQPWVWRQLSGIAEVAQGKPARQSSTELAGVGGAAARGVDGSTSNNDWTQGSCSATLENEGQVLDPPWWQVDLDEDYEVVAVQFWPRTDCCTDRGTRYTIALGTSMVDPSGLTPHTAPSTRTEVGAASREVTDVVAGYT